MKKRFNRPSVKLAYLIFFLSCCAFFINSLHYQYIGNSYFPPNTVGLFSLILLASLGCQLQFGQLHFSIQITRELVHFYLVMAIIALATTAVQFTPFQPIDTKLISIENLLHIPFVSLLNWTTQHPQFHLFLCIIYDTLPLQMIYIPLIIIFMCKNESVIDEYYFLLLCSSLLGFLIYYFWPTTAPASNIIGPEFLEVQYATGNKFWEIHQGLKPSTNEGGLIAFPSFHVIWAWFCVYLIKPWRIAFYFLLSINCILFASCILLGWHYPIDLLGSFFIIICSHLAYRFFYKHHWIGTH